MTLLVLQVDNPTLNPEEMVGRKIELMWQLTTTGKESSCKKSKKQYLPGVIVGHDREYCHIKYDDGDTEWVNLLRPDLQRDWRLVE